MNLIALICQQVYVVIFVLQRQNVQVRLPLTQVHQVTDQLNIAKVHCMIFQLTMLHWTRQCPPRYCYCTHFTCTGLRWGEAVSLCNHILAIGISESRQDSIFGLTIGTIKIFPCRVNLFQLLTSVFTKNAVFQVEIIPREINPQVILFCHIVLCCDLNAISRMYVTQVYRCFPPHP